jgi:hypothetical protein
VSEGASFVCRKCKDLVIVPTHAVLSEEQKAAMRSNTCRDCLGVVRTKPL